MQSIDLKCIAEYCSVVQSSAGFRRAQERNAVRVFGLLPEGFPPSAEQCKSEQRKAQQSTGKQSGKPFGVYQFVFNKEKS
jgi:hypothetical protein